MKMFAQRFGFVSIVILYLFTVYNYNKSIVHAAVTAQSNSTDVYIVDSDGQNYPFLFTFNQPQSSNLVEGFNNIPTPVRKSHTLNSFERSNPLEYINFIAFSKFIFYSSKTVIQFQKTDIPFPFHQFS